MGHGVDLIQEPQTRSLAFENRYPTIPACVVALCGIALIILGVVYPKGSLPHGSPTLAELQQKHHMAWAELLWLDLPLRGLILHASICD